LVAEGDSWFDYPFHDVLKILKDDHGYDFKYVADKCDRVEKVAHSNGQLEEFTRRIEKLLSINEIFLFNSAPIFINGSDFISISATNTIQTLGS
jgi:hypothetical protein